ncbi:DUF4041 domain-containing protein [Paludisphaera sp.]|uniref:DUF4041 domain-containing protein n=1 Tax=Paludisphaera sp. TaxID=2017432 RepID=UPI00301BA2E0
MLYLVLIVLVFVLAGVAAYGIFKASDLERRLRQTEDAWHEEEEAYLAAIGGAEERAKVSEARFGELAAASAREIAQVQERNRDVIAAHSREISKLEERNRACVQRIRELDRDLWHTKDTAARHEAELLSELTKLEKIRHVPGLIERAERKSQAAEAMMAEAKEFAEAAFRQAEADGRERARVITAQAQAEMEAARRYREQQTAFAASIEEEARNILGAAGLQARQALDEARAEARELASKARKDAKEKREQSKAALDLVTKYALEIRQQAEHRAWEIAGDGYNAKARVDELRAEAEALQNRIKNYEGVYLVPPGHILDELADEFGFSKAGEKLKLARERTALMQENGTAATCGYPDGWKKDHALKFVLGTFNGKVDTVLARVKPANQGKLIQEIKDAYALVNKDGEVYKDAKIRREYLDSRLDELKWGVAVQKLKEKGREEQRAIRERMREEARAQKEIERAVKQAEREEELVNRAINRLRQQLEAASEAERAKLEAQLQEMDAKLVEAEERGRRAISMAEQTKKGHVYIISNVGAFGENVYKIGLTRRLEPGDRVRELGGASVPFPFDVHAMLECDDAPATEAALHRRFVERQVNKVNRRKEFFRVSVRELKEAAEEMGLAGKWTIESAASEYRETVALERAMDSDADVRRTWLERQATLDFGAGAFDEDEEAEEAEDAGAPELEPAGARSIF